VRQALHLEGTQRRTGDIENAADAMMRLLEKNTGELASSHEKYINREATYEMRGR